MASKMKDRSLFLLGIAVCFAVAAVSVLAARLIPGDLLGASIAALFMGTVINSFFHPDWIKPALKFTSQKIPNHCIIPTVLVLAFFGAWIKGKELQKSGAWV